MKEAYEQLNKEIEKAEKSVTVYREMLNKAMKKKDVVRAVELLQRVREREQFVNGLVNAKVTIESFCWQELGLTNP